MIQFNLLPDIKKEYIKAQETKLMVVSISTLVTIGSLGLTLLLYVYVFFIQQVQINLLTGDIKKKGDNLSSVPELSKYLTIQNQLASLPSLHAQKGYYMRLFDFLPTLNPGKPDDVKLSSLQMSVADKTISLTGTTGSFQSLNIFTDTLRNAVVSYQQGSAAPQSGKVFSSVYVQNSDLAHTANGLVVSFAIRTIYSDYVFDTNNSGVSVSVPNIKTTQSITESPKLPLFDTSKSGGQ
ncbi:MAG TPA: hypothetical protein VNX65_01905 [Patescibacteria group bacterium]|jgi:Tfp pilus assembly protein PilN|nr:hypothetical protein [Patescibacteria group bacterium]